ncbi:MAG: spore coat protein [Clostridia bacterium]|nr:spore coat protein [Clostridia bacterium]
MTLTQKETDILNDLKSQEQLCISKYEKYENEACDPALKSIFHELRTVEENHLSTVCKLLSGEEVTMASAPPAAASETYNGAPSSCDKNGRDTDAFLCKDALAMEKHVSSVYDTGIFEFSQPPVRDTLAHIQKEEQNHGEKLYSYMSKNNMYS